MDPHLSSHVHAAAAASPNGKATGDDALPSAVVDVEAPAPTQTTSEADPSDSGVDYMARAQWLRAAVLGANDGLVSVASLMIGVGAVNVTRKAMLVSGLAGLVAGACSMAIGEFVSVYAQYDIEVLQIKRDGEGDAADGGGSGGKESLPSPTQAALASALAFAVGALLPLMSGVFIPSWAARVAAVCAASSAGLAGFGAAGAYLGGANVVRSGLRVLVGGWFAMLVTYGVLRLFGTVFHIHLSSA
ncbi:vacuolar iron transporter homolog 2-like [Phragmites australis]|uniref:vacuolar iron transporter homolog 2-like n=1 Tax=Phragmites australis TaxID=29695 RepID=UPI002D767583|nr:vacuolar iron transporter homolog 2-like [Phragmites australis]